jgi:hypothetical protein
MTVREPHPLCGQLIHVWRGDFGALWMVRVHVAITEIIGEDDDDVGRGREERGRQEKEEQQVFHAAFKR